MAAAGSKASHRGDGGSRLAVEGLCVDYGYGRVVTDVSFEVRPGEILAMVGANGAGKTSTLRALAGLTPSAGSVRIDDVRISRMSPVRRMRHGLALVPDDRALFRAHSVRDHFWLATRRHSRPKDSTLSEIYSLFPILKDRQKLAAGSLSGGEQQMLAIAMAVIAAPKFILIDEMSTGLAPVVVKRLFTTIRDLAESKGIGVVLVEQFVSEALAISDQAIVLGRGKVQLSGNAADLRDRMPDVTAAYFS
jgi:branched-chain amino acid transport system ATP-binding protein